MTSDVKFTIARYHIEEFLKRDGPVIIFVNHIVNTANFVGVDPDTWLKHGFSKLFQVQLAVAAGVVHAELVPDALKTASVFEFADDNVQAVVELTGLFPHDLFLDEGNPGLLSLLLLNSDRLFFFNALQFLLAVSEFGFGKALLVSAGCV